MPRAKAKQPDPGEKTEQKIREVVQIIEYQQSLIHGLRQEVADCRSESLVLRECLEEANFIDRGQFALRLHRRRFDALCAKHRYVADACLTDILDADGVAQRICSAAGTADVLGVSCASRSTRKAMNQSLQLVSNLRACIYVFGGQKAGKPRATVERYSIVDGGWEVRQDLMHARRAPMAGIIDETLYVCGGHDGDTVSASMERYSLTKQIWEAGPPMLSPRWGAVCGVIDDCLYIAGGKGEDVEVSLNTAERYNDKLKVWESLPPMAEGRSQPAGGALDGRLIVCGGFTSSQGALSSVESFVVSEGKWEAMPSMSLCRARATAGTIAGKLFVCGGRKASMSAFNLVECLGPAVPDVGHHARLSVRGQAVEEGYDWSFDPLQPSEVGEVSDKHENQVYVTGPRGDGDWYFLDDLESTTWGWETMPAMSVSRVDAAAAVWGRCLYLFGGYDGKKGLKTVERFDTITGAWEPLKSMQEERMMALAVGARVRADGDGETSYTGYSAEEGRLDQQISQ